MLRTQMAFCRVQCFIFRSAFDRLAFSCRIYPYASIFGRPRRGPPALRRGQGRSTMPVGVGPLGRWKKDDICHLLPPLYSAVLGRARPTPLPECSKESSVAGCNVDASSDSCVRKCVPGPLRSTSPTCPTPFPRVLDVDSSHQSLIALLFVSLLRASAFVKSRLCPRFSVVLKHKVDCRRHGRVRRTRSRSSPSSSPEIAADTHRRRPVAGGRQRLRGVRRSPLPIFPSPIRN